MTHLQTQVFMLLLGEQAEDDTTGGPCTDMDLYMGLTRREGPQQLVLYMAPSVEGELWNLYQSKNITMTYL